MVYNNHVSTVHAYTYVCIHHLKFLTGSKYYLYDAGYESLSSNLINTLDSLGITTTNGHKSFRVAGVIISPAYKHLSLQHLLENYKYVPFDLLTNFNFGNFGIPHQLGGTELDVDKHDKFGTNSCVPNIFETPFCLLYSSADPLTEYKIEKQTNPINEKSLLENASAKIKKPCIIQIYSTDDESKKNCCPGELFLSGNLPIDQMILTEYTFFVFQVPHHRQRPKLVTEVQKNFPNQELIENAAKLMALYNYRHILGAEINLLSNRHPLHETAKSFNSYFMKKESGSENKVMKAFIKMFLNHTRLHSDPDDCFSLDNPQVVQYEKCGKEMFSSKVIKGIEKERKRQVDQILFICECVEWAYYYKIISAEVYTVSAGNEYNKVALQAIIGIMIACEWNSVPCRFAFTNSNWLNYIGELMPRVLREYVTLNTQIWFLNGTGGGLEDKPFFTIDLCSTLYTNNEGSNDKNQPPAIKIATASRSVVVRGMNLLKLEDIRNEEDHRNNGSHVSAALKAILSRQPLKHNDRINDKSCFLTPYLEHIGYPNPSKPVQVKDVMRCVIGDLLVSQMMNLNKDYSEYFEILPELLNCRAKGLSKFVLNFTKTAAISANIIVNISNNPLLTVSNKKLLEASFEIAKAKAPNLKIIMHLTIADKRVPLNLVKHFNLNGSFGITLAEYIAHYNYTGITWKPAMNLSVGEALYVLFKEDYVVSILKSIPHCISAKVVSLCKIQHYFSYIKLDDENRIEEAHIQMESPGTVGNDDICLDIESISLHLYPLCAVVENSVQINGRGLINGSKVEFSSTPSSYLSQDLDVKFCDLFTIGKAFDILNLKANEDAIKQHFKCKDVNSFITHLIFSQTLPHSMATEVTFLAFGEDFNTLKDSLPPLFSHVTIADSYLGLHYPYRNNISNPVINVSEKANFALNPPSSNGNSVHEAPSINSKSMPESKLFNCSLCRESKEKLTVNILPFQDCENLLHGKVLLEAVEALCNEMDCRLVEKIEKILPIKENLSNISVVKLQLSFIGLKLSSVNLNLSLENCELLSAPCLTLHNASLKAVYSTQGEFTLECLGKLTLQLQMHENLHTFSFKGELILPIETSKGILHFDNYNNFTLKNLIEAFGWTPNKVKSIPILSSALAIVVRKVCIEFDPVSSSGGLQVSSLSVIVYLQELDIGILKMSHIHLEIKFVREENKNEFKTYFKLKALISENLFVEIEYNPDDHLLHGLVNVCDFKAVTAADGLSAFHVDGSDPSSQSFSNMKMVLQDCLMQAFDSSENAQKEGANLVAFIKFDICMPSKDYKEYVLEHIELQVKDCLCIRNCMFDTIKFNYSKTLPTSSEAHLMAILRVKSSKESLKITFDLTRTSDKPTVLSATVEPNDSKGGISLHSIFELVSCIPPGLPEVGLPPIFKLLIVHGFVSFTLSPFQVCKCDVTVIIPKWQIFNDPNLCVQDIKIRAVWESGMTMPNLIFDNCTLMLQSWKLSISGQLKSDVITIKCASDSSPPDTTKFESFLQKYTPNSEVCPTIPPDIELPQLTVSDIHIGIKLREDVKTFSLASTITNVWAFYFGEILVQVREISGSLEWTKHSNSTSKYTAILYGLFELGSISISASMCLGYKIDSILVATITNVDYTKIANYLTSQSFDSSLVPQNVQEINSFTAQLAFNVTKKHFFLTGSVERWGKCILLVGYLRDQNDIDYAIMITIGDSFRFSQLSDSLAFVDDYVTVQCANLLVSSVDLDALKSVMKPFEEAPSQIQNPFATLPKVDNNKLVSNEVKRGTTLYAVLDIHSCKQSKGTIGNLFQLGDQSLAQNDIIVKVYIDNFSGFVSNMEVFAYLPLIRLFGMLEFSMIEMLYQISQKGRDAFPDYSLVLTGRVTFGLDLNTNHDQNISFDGKLHVTTTDACFEASYSNNQSIEKPAGINVTVEKLMLKLRLKLCEDERKIPNIFIYGRISIGRLIMESMLILKGTSFEVFEIKLISGLTLHALFACSDINWADSSLTIDIMDGKFYYARDDFNMTDDNNQVVHYEKGFSLTCVIKLFGSDFRIKAHCVPHDRSKLSLSGRSVKKIDLGFAKLTGTDAYIHEGPEIRYHDNRLSLNVGVELFNRPELKFKGCLSYLINEKALEGTICYLGNILWIKKNPQVTVQWSQERGFQIIEFPMLGSPFNLLGAIAKYAIVLYRLITGIFSWGITLKLRTDKNPDPNRYLVKLVLGGSISVTIAGFITVEMIPLPDIPLKIVKMKDFTLEKLPKFILTCLWESAGDICKSLLRYINPIDLAWRMGKMIVQGVVKVVKTVVNVVKNVAKKAWGFCKSIFGWSAFLVDSTERTVLGYIYSGKDGEKLHNIEYTVNNFGEFLVAHTIEKIAKDVHTNATTCLQIEENSDHSGELDKLQEVTKSLSCELSLAADEVLAIKHIAAHCCSGELCIKWQVGNIGGKIYDEDRGDIEYHVKVIVIMAKVKMQNVSVFVKKIHDKMVTPIYPNNQAKNENKLESRDSKEYEMTEKEKTHEEEKETLISQLQSEEQHEGEMELDKAKLTKTEESHFESGNDETRMLSANIPIDCANLDEALCIFISIKPTVTLRIKTLPPEKEPREIDEESLQSEDKEWMRSIKDEINKLGREKEVTLIGKTGYFRHFLKSLNTKSELNINGRFMYSEETKILTVKGELKPIPQASHYLIQITDMSDETIVIKNEMISLTPACHGDNDELKDNECSKDHYNSAINDNDDKNDEDDHSDEDDDSISSNTSDSGNDISNEQDRRDRPDICNGIAFSFDTMLSKIPNDSPGPYSITAYALTETLECLHVDAIPNVKMSRCKPPVNIDVELPSSNENPKVTLKWEPATDQDEHMFEIKICVTCTKQNSTNGDIDIGSDFLLKESDETYTHLIPASEIEKQTNNEDRNKVHYTYKFDLISLFDKSEISLQTGVVVNCDIFGISKLSTSLPSLPASQKFIIVASPPKFEVNPNKVTRINPGLKLLWTHTMHAVSYETELVDKVTTSIKHSKEHKFDKNATDDFSADSVLDLDDLRALLDGDGPKHYQLQMFSQGLGQYLIRSLAPRVAEEEIVVSPVDIEYVSSKEAVSVQFISFMPQNATVYEVALYQHNKVYSLLSKQKVEVTSSYRSRSLVYCEFNSQQWKHCIKAGCGVSAYVHAGEVNHIYYLGVSAEVLFFLPPPLSITTKAHYKVNWLVDCIDIKWSSVRHAECYQFGFQSLHGSSTIWSRSVFGDKAKISSSEFTSMSSAVCRCFVKSVGHNNKMNSNPTTDNAACYQFINGADGKTLIFTSVSLLAMQNLSINLAKISWLLIYKQRVLPKGYPFPREYFSSKIFNKFWQDYCYDCQGMVAAFSVYIINYLLI